MLLSVVMQGCAAPADRSSDGAGASAALRAQLTCPSSVKGSASLPSASWPPLFNKKRGPIQASQGLALAPQVWGSTGRWQREL